MGDGVLVVQKNELHPPSFQIPKRKRKDHEITPPTPMLTHHKNYKMKKIKRNPSPPPIPHLVFYPIVKHSLNFFSGRGGIFLFGNKTHPKERVLLAIWRALCFSLLLKELYGSI